MSKSKTPDAEQLKKEWAELARKIEEITGERPSGQEPQKPVCANCKWRANNGILYDPIYWLCTNKDIGLASETYNPVTGETTQSYNRCMRVNYGTCKGFEPKRTWGQWLAGILCPNRHRL